MKRFYMILALLVSVLAAKAKVVEIDGIWYNINQESKVASVTIGENRYSGDVVIPESVNYEEMEYSVTSIGNYAFRGCSGLTSVTIPDSVTSIGIDAFNGCSGLTSVTIPNSVTSIGNRAFYSCSGLTSVTIPNSVTSIGMSAFYDCLSLTSVTIPSSVTSIGGEAFFGCSRVKELIYEEGCTTALATGLSSITSVTIPNSVTSIGNSAFRDCSGLTSVTIPNSVTSIGMYAFGDCSGLTSVTIPNSVTSIGSSAFYKCSGLTSVTIPNSVTSIGSSAFYKCSGLTWIDIPNSVTSIGDEAFYGCTGLTSVTIGNSVTSIGLRAFEYCSGLTWIDIPNSVTSIGDEAFSGCYVTRFTNNSNVDGTFGVTVCDTEQEDGLLIKDNLAVSCRLWATSVTIPNSVTSIGIDAFNGCSGLTSVTIPNSVTSIGDRAFYGCKIRSLKCKASTPPSYLYSYSPSFAVFSDQTYYHTTLYVPVGSWDAYAYDGLWYRFINIREEATERNKVRADEAYTLMNSRTMSYLVYDATNNKVAEVKSVSNIDEGNLNHNWMSFDIEGKSYVYNIGSRKYLQTTAKGFVLSDSPSAITIANGEDGMKLGQDSNEWSFVRNQYLQADEVITPIVDLMAEKNVDSTPYTLDGRKASEQQKGILVINGKKYLKK